MCLHRVATVNEHHERVVWSWALSETDSLPASVSCLDISLTCLVVCEVGERELLMKVWSDEARSCGERGFWASGKKVTAHSSPFLLPLHQHESRIGTTMENTDRATSPSSFRTASRSTAPAHPCHGLSNTSTVPLRTTTHQRTRVRSKSVTEDGYTYQPYKDDSRHGHGHETRVLGTDSEESLLFKDSNKAS